jgi:hypothetical protein
VQSVHEAFDHWVHGSTEAESFDIGGPSWNSEFSTPALGQLFVEPAIATANPQGHTGWLFLSYYSNPLAHFQIPGHAGMAEHDLRSTKRGRGKEKTGDRLAMEESVHRWRL